MTPYDMPDYHALIRHIRDVDRAGGDSTLARMVCADWLEEQGEEGTACWIRWIIDQRIPTANSGWHGGNIFGWKIPLKEHERAADIKLLTREGFVEGVRCCLAWWLAHGPDLCRRHPVREVVITDCGRVIDVSTSWHRRLEMEPFPRWAGSGMSPRPEIVTSVISEINYGHPACGSESEITGKVNAAWLKWAEAEADTTPEG